MFTLSSSPIKPKSFQKLSPQIGACVTFEGLVRDHNDGKKVLALEYEAFEKLSTQEAEKILEETKSKFDIIDVHCIHRIGKLFPGECAVRVDVTAAHRDSAFQACRYVIDELKTRVPIWKKEYYASGASDWVNAQGSRSDL